MKKLSPLLLILALSTLASCGGDKKVNQGVQANAALTTIFVHGDPQTIIEGSTYNKQSFINESSITDFNNFALESVYQFTEKEVILVKEDTEDIEAGNEATEDDQTTKAVTYFNFEKTGTAYTYSNPGVNLELIFSTKNGKLELTKLGLLEGDVELNILHYSEKISKEAFSFLVELQDPAEGRILLSFTFVKKSEQQEIKKSSQSMRYIYGPGVMVNWEQSQVMQIDICGQQPSYLEEAYKAGFALWSPSLKDRLEIKTNVLKNYPPFSDLNVNCIYTVDNYQTQESADRINGGTTYTNGNTFTGHIINSDIMIWMKENEKYGVPKEYAYKMKKIVAHEFGHVLGLDHQFEDDIPSIMGYSAIDFLTNYDRSAIQGLYPLK